MIDKYYLIGGPYDGKIVVLKKDTTETLEFTANGKTGYYGLFSDIYSHEYRVLVWYDKNKKECINCKLLHDVPVCSKCLSTVNRSLAGDLPLWNS